jgi:hypothetical protein
MANDPEYELQIRAAHTQSTFRSVNQHIRDFNERFGAENGQYVIACECADDDCALMLEVPAYVYRAIRENPGRFLVATGHVLDDVELVVEEGGDYEVVEKLAKAGEYAEAAASRGRPPDAPDADR